MSVFPTSFRSELLTGIKVFQGLDAKACRRLSRYVEAAVYEAGATLFEPTDQESSALQIVLSGAVDLLRPSVGGAPEIVARVGPGSVLSETSLLEPGPRTLGARAHSVALLLTLRAERFEALRASEPSIALAIAMNLGGAVTRRLREVTDQKAQVAAAAPVAAGANGRSDPRGDLERFRAQLHYEWQFE